MKLRILDEQNKLLAESDDIAGTLWLLQSSEQFTNVEKIIAPVIEDGQVWQILFGSLLVCGSGIDMEELYKDDVVVFQPGMIAISVVQRMALANGSPGRIAAEPKSIR